jgi:predicted dehydrogenase
MLKVCVIGGGINSAVGTAHLAAIRLSNKYEIWGAVFSRDGNTNYESARKYGITDDKIFSCYKEMIDFNCGIIDAVIILTPTTSHIDQVIYSLDKDINVICEKALASSVKEVKVIQKALHKSKASLFVIYNYLGYPMVKEMRSLVNRGRLGKVYSIQVEMPQEGFVKRIKGELATPQKWRLVDNMAIPTISLDLGVHLHSLIKFITQLTPVSVVSLSKSRGAFTQVITEIHTIIEYSDEVMCSMWFGKTSLGHRNGMKLRIYGSDGSVFWEQINPEFVVFNDVEGRVSVLDRNSPDIEIANSIEYNLFKGGHPSGFVEALCNYYLDLYNEVKKPGSDQSNEMVFGILEATEGLRLFEGVQKSSQKRQWISL